MSSYGQIPPPPSYPPPYPPPPSPYGAPLPPRRTPWLLIIGGVVLALLLAVGLAVGGLLLVRGGDEDRSPGDAGPRNTDPSSPVATAPTTATESVPAPTLTTQTSREALLGTWTGVYDCAQGETGLRLTIERGPGPADIRAVFAFSPTEDNPDVPRGSFSMTGTVADGLLQLHATTWIRQPRGFVTVDLRAPVTEVDPSRIAGEIVDGPGCSTFIVERSSSP